MKINASELLETTVAQKASGLHLVVGSNPIIRVNNRLVVLTNYPVLAAEDIELFLNQLFTQEQKDIYAVNKDLDFSFSFGRASRFRVNAFYQKGYPSVALRVIPFKVPTIDELRLPNIVRNLAGLTQGLLLVTGPTGQGKSTTIAAMIENINESKDMHIITIEDPIEYIFVNKRSLIEQREMYLDTHSWEIALRSVLRQDPNVVVVGEMRDYDTISAALNIAETGHLVIATLHTNSAAQTIDRIVSVFPENQQQQVRMQLASILEGIVSQRLVTSKDGSLVPAVEVLLGSPAVRNQIREGKAHLIDNTIATSYDLGMTSIDRSLAELVNKGWVDQEEAIKHTTRPDEMVRYIGS